MLCVFIASSSSPEDTRPSLQSVSVFIKTSSETSFFSVLLCAVHLPLYVCMVLYWFAYLLFYPLTLNGPSVSLDCRCCFVPRWFWSACADCERSFRLTDRKTWVCFPALTVFPLIFTLQLLSVCSSLTPEQVDSRRWFRYRSRKQNSSLRTLTRLKDTNLRSLQSIKDGRANLFRPNTKVRDFKSLSDFEGWNNDVRLMLKTSSAKQGRIQTASITETTVSRLSSLLWF